MESTLADLSHEQLQNLGRNLILLKEAEAVASALEKRKIPALFLKGIALLDTAYESLVAREMVDIDLLVPIRDLEQTVAVLRNAGYTARKNALVLSKDVGEFLVQIDLHHSRWVFATEQYWDRSRRKSPSSPMRILCPEDEFLLCILHSVIQDGRASNQALADCAALLRVYGAEFSWEQFGTTVSSGGWEQPVAVFLASLAAICPSQVPDRLLEDARMPSLALSSESLSKSPYLRMLKLQSRWPKRIGILMQLLFPDPHFLRMRYSWMPEKLSFLLWVLRPFFLLAQYISGRMALLRSG